ncbi:MAG: hypothetical protein HY320_15025 [Armatimonadetes bacterium]|nr:hypothetical protein [Armatimonadota bacterium]
MKWAEAFLPELRGARLAAIQDYYQSLALPAVQRPWLVYSGLRARRILARSSLCFLIWMSRYPGA